MDHGMGKVTALMVADSKILITFFLLIPHIPVSPCIPLNPTQLLLFFASFHFYSAIFASFHFLFNLHHFFQVLLQDHTTNPRQDLINHECYCCNTLYIFTSLLVLCTVHLTTFILIPSIITHSITISYSYVMLLTASVFLLFICLSNSAPQNEDQVVWFDTRKSTYHTL